MLPVWHLMLTASGGDAVSDYIFLQRPHPQPLHRNTDIQSKPVSGGTTSAGASYGFHCCPSRGSWQRCHADFRLIVRKLYPIRRPSEKAVKSTTYGCVCGKEYRRRSSPPGIHVCRKRWYTLSTEVETFYLWVCYVPVTFTFPSIHFTCNRPVFMITPAVKIVASHYNIHIFRQSNDGSLYSSMNLESSRIRQGNGNENKLALDDKFPLTKSTR